MLRGKGSTQKELQRDSNQLLNSRKSAPSRGNNAVGGSNSERGRADEEKQETAETD